jgi:NitT/TauT family transport system permease protein
MDKRNIETIKTYILAPITLSIFILFWEIIANLKLVDALILPSPSSIMLAFIQNFAELSFHLGITAFESILGFGVGVIGAFLFAILFIYSKDVKSAFLPFAVALKATPLVALAPLVILWFGNDIHSKIVMGAMVAFFPVLINSLDGMGSVQKEQLNLMKSYSATRLQTLLKLRIPNSMPFIISSLKVASTLAIVGVVIGEFTGATSGLGYIIINSLYYLETPLMFAAIILISLWGILFYGVIVLIENQFNKTTYYREEQ